MQSLKKKKFPSPIASSLLYSSLSNLSWPDCLLLLEFKLYERGFFFHLLQFSPVPRTEFDLYWSMNGLVE